MPGNIIQWFPGHMAATRRLIRENLGSVDIVFELLDARIPESSRNPEIRSLLGDKKTVIILNKADLADPEKTKLWEEYFKQNENTVPVPVDCKSGKGTREIMDAARHLLREKLQREREKGMKKPIRAMVVGIPNVGKSTLINRFAGAKKAQAENRPGVTKTKQWVKASAELELLDMPGVLWPKFEDVITGENLAMTGAIKDAILQSEEIACLLCARLKELYPLALKERYKLSDQQLQEDAYDLFLSIGKKRGFLQGGGVVNEERCSAVLLDEFRSGILGRMTLEVPK
ncbi:MAG: ribosome biogenesis GTPase YlqF [Clostridia bacterium]|nr:ribosome biogenesis GTPase YlqF [Clostridia bacterium]